MPTVTDALTVPAEPAPPDNEWINALGTRTAKARSRRSIPVDVALVAMSIGFLVMQFTSNHPQARAAMYAASLCAMAAFTARAILNARWQRGYHQALQHCKEAAAAVAKQRAEHRRAKASRRMAFRLPRQPVGEGYLYVLEFSTGTVKVGRTEDPRRRLGQHLGEARAFGVSITNYWISPAHINFQDNETRLINACLKVSSRTRKEYFHEVGYERARQFTSALTYFSDDLTQTSVEGVWA